MSLLARALHAQPPGSYINEEGARLQRLQTLLDQREQCRRAFAQAPSPREGIPESYDWPRMFGEQIAHQHEGRWYEAAGPMKHAWHEITDPKVIALLERLPHHEVGT